MANGIHVDGIRAYLERCIYDFMFQRYNREWLGASPMVETEVSQNDRMLATQINLRIDKTWNYDLLVDDRLFLQNRDPHDWVEYQLQNIKHATDSAVFLRWLFDKLDHEGKRLLRDRCQGLIKQVSYVPPGQCSDPHRVSNHWLACVHFENGQMYREILGNIAIDPDTFLAQLLMMVP